MEGPVLWAGQRWIRVVEQAAPGAAMVEGLEYAREGQTKKLVVSAGKVEGLVQGRGDRPYVTVLEVGTLAGAAWERIVAVMSEGSLYAAKMLANELPTNIEDVFGPLDLRLFPVEARDIRVSCTCPDFVATQTVSAEAVEGEVAVNGEVGAAATGSDPRWCKHACCVALLMGQRLSNEPFLMFSLRGLDAQEMLEQLRDKRAMAGGGSRTPVYQQHVPGLTELDVKPLEGCVEGFWDGGVGLKELEIPLGKPEVSHPLLRRLGPSPLAGTFPLVGLLASCYDVISEEALRRSGDVGVEVSGDEVSGEE